MSKLLSASEVYMKITGHVPLKQLSGIDREWIEKCIREAMTITRDVTLEVAAEEAEITGGCESSERCCAIIDKDSIICLKTHKDLKIQ